VPYFEKQPHRINAVGDGGKCILILDGWKVQMQDSFKNYVAMRWPWLVLKYLPPNTTSHLQPMDVGVQKPLKDAMRQVFAVYLSEISRLQILSGKDRSVVKIDLRLSILKAVMCDVVKSAYVRLKPDTDLLKLAWQRSGESSPGDGGLLKCFEATTQLEAYNRHTQGTLVPPTTTEQEGEPTPSPYEDEGAALKPLLDMLNDVAAAPTKQLVGEGIDGVSIARAQTQRKRLKYNAAAVSIGEHAAAKTMRTIAAETAHADGAGRGSRGGKAAGTGSRGGKAAGRGSRGGKAASRGGSTVSSEPSSSSDEESLDISSDDEASASSSEESQASEGESDDDDDLAGLKLVGCKKCNWAPSGCTSCKV